ncbi:phosphate ABC transporter ATP-binding protein [Baaleninema simplex]|uniref:phosphate ABC transporter ATP-binding protein n=1 Tax=Baaleninema simplex TaxID=2862350 RepID=UPI000348FFE8|nr:phosphate ABC transporter ATP-binding protein [Baaleninema simplex]
MERPTSRLSVSDGLDPLLRVENLSVLYRGVPALTDVNLTVYRHQVTGAIGPSGCGKSTFLRCLNRLNEEIDGTTVTGRVWLGDRDLGSLHPVEVRRRIGMVFQRPNPFAKSIYDNIAVPLRANGYRGNLDERVETSLRQVGLWEEVKQDLKKNAWELSGGQQQRLCIARAIALDPEVILMDEPCASLDPISSNRIDDLLCQMKERYTIVIVTHNLKQAARVTDWIAFFNVENRWQRERDRPRRRWFPWARSPEAVSVPSVRRVGTLVEYAPTLEIFTRPRHQSARDYLSAGSQRR